MVHSVRKSHFLAGIPQISKVSESTIMKLLKLRYCLFLLFFTSAILSEKHIHSCCHLVIIRTSYEKPNSLSRESKITYFVHRNNLICLPSSQTHHLSHFINSSLKIRIMSSIALNDCK